MVYTVTITSQGQLSLPAKIRRELGFSKTNKALVTVVDGKVTIEPIVDFLSLKGSIKPKIKKKPLTNQQIHDLFAQGAVERYKKSLK